MRLYEGETEKRAAAQQSNWRERDTRQVVTDTSDVK
jgi:hypothetical protein